MSEGGHSRPHWPDGGPLLDGFLTAAREAWIARAGGVEVDQLAWLARLLQPGRSLVPGAPQPSRLAAEFLGQAALIAMTSGFRYWSCLAAVCDERLSPLARMGLGTAQELSEADRLLLTDSLRGLARELGGAASQEARRFQTELDRLALGLATQTEASRAAVPRRYGRAKP